METQKDKTVENDKKNLTSFTQFNSHSESTQSPLERRRFGGEDEVRTIDAMIDFIYPAIPLPSNKIFKAMGEEKIREMVAYQHALLMKTRVKEIFPEDHTAYKIAVDKAADFFVESLGGDRVFSKLHGEPHLRMRHLHVPIDENHREIWIAMYKKTLKDLDFPKEHLQEFWNFIEPISIRMISKRTSHDPIKRYYWEDVKSEFLK